MIVSQSTSLSSSILSNIYGIICSSNDLGFLQSGQTGTFALSILFVIPAHNGFKMCYYELKHAG